MKIRKPHRFLMNTLAGGMILLAAAPTRAATHSQSAVADLDMRDYTLTVASAHGNPVPAVGTHTYAWHATVSASVEAEANGNTCTGWTGTGAIPESGDTHETGEFLLTEVESSIEWQWMQEQVEWNVLVRSVPVAGVHISGCTEQSTGVTEYEFSLTEGNSVYLSAPEGFVEGQTEYIFERWEGDAITYAGWSTTNCPETQYPNDVCLTVSPSHPVPGEPITLTLSGFVPHRASPRPEAMDVSVTDSTIYINLHIFHPPGDVGAQVLTPWQLEETLPSLPQGNYEVIVSGWDTGGTIGHIYNTPNAQSRTIRLTAVDEDMTLTAVYAPCVAELQFDPDGGAFHGESVVVTVTCATEGATIHYTIDGSEPTTGSPTVVSGGTVTVPLPGTLKARAWKDGLDPSEVKVAEYSESDLTGNVFVTSDQSGTYNIWSARLDGNNRLVLDEQLTHLESPFSVGDIRVDEANRRIVYSHHESGKRVGGLSVIDFDGRLITEITNLPAGGGGSSAFDLSPDGSEVVFAKGVEDQGLTRQKAYIVGIDNTNLRRVIEDTQPRGVVTHKTGFLWLEDGRILFANTLVWSDYAGQHDLHIYDNGTFSAWGGNTAEGERNPVLNPSQTILAVESLVYGSSGVNIANWPDGNQSVLIPRTSVGARPRFFRDDQTLVYMSGGDLFSVRVDGSGLINLTEDIDANVSGFYELSDPGPVTLNFAGITYAVTENIYEDVSDWDAAVASEFGPGWAVADWNDIKAVFGTSHDNAQLLADFISDSNPESSRGSVYVTRGGRRVHSGSRHYFASAHYGNKPGSYLAHDNMQGYMVSLGSWWGSSRILAQKVGSTLQLDIDPESREHPFEGADGETIAVTANVAWTAVPNRDWIRVTGGHSGQDNGTVTYRVDENSGDARTGTISVSGAGITRVFRVEQEEMPRPPEVPSGLVARAPDSSQVDLSWNESARAAEYELQRRDLPLGDWRQVMDPRDVLLWIDSDVLGGERYAYRVRALNEHGNSAWSQPVSVSVPGAPGQGDFGLQVSNAVARASGDVMYPAGHVLCGAPVDGTLDAMVSNPTGVFTQHRVVAGFRDATGRAAGTPLEIGALTGAPADPPQWIRDIHLPRGLRVPPEPGVYSLWIESYLGSGDPREAFAAEVRVQESALARQVVEVEAMLPDEGSIFVALGSASARAGEVVELPLMTAALRGENAFSLSLAYDDASVELVRIEPVGTMGGAYMETNTQTPGQAGVVMMLPAGGHLDSGLQDIARVVFRIREQAEAGTVLPVELTDQPTFRMVTDPFANIMPHLFMDGVITVAAQGWEADVSPRGNPDGQVDHQDRMQIMRFVVGLDQPEPGREFQAADCAPIETRGDGIIDIRDAVVAERYADGLEDLKELGGPTEPISGPVPAASPMVMMDAMSLNTLLHGDEEMIQMGVTGLISLQTGFADHGQLLEMPVKVLSGGNVAGVSFSIGFDPSQLVFLDAVPAAGYTDAIAVANDERALSGVVGYASRLPAGRTLARGEAHLMTLRFRVVASAEDDVTLVRVTTEPTPVILSDSDGEAISVSTQSATVYLMPGDTEGLPDVVTGLGAELEGDSRIHLTWNGSSGAGAYRVYRRSSDEMWGMISEQPADRLGYVDNGVVPGREYTYRVAAVNEAGERSSDHLHVAVPGRYRLWADRNIGDVLSAPGEDASGDGVSNHLKYLMGADPLEYEPGRLSTQFRDVYGFGEQYFTLHLQIREDVPRGSLEIDTAGCLVGGEWRVAPEIDNTVIDGRRHLEFRVSDPVEQDRAQFFRIRTRE